MVVFEFASGANNKKFRVKKSNKEIKGWHYRKNSCISRTRVLAAPPTFKHDFEKKKPKMRFCKKGDRLFAHQNVHK